MSEDFFHVDEFPPERPSMREQLTAPIAYYKKRSRELDPEEAEQIEWALEHFDGGSWFPMGIPTAQTELTQAFSKTEDARRLIRELLTLRGSGKPVMTVVADSPFNIYRSLKKAAVEAKQKVDEAALFTEAHRRARLIGLKDRYLYQAIGQQILEENFGGELNLRGVPVVLMSELSSYTHFGELFENVIELFDSNFDFAELVYACVPASLRHRKHRTKTLRELRTLEGTALTEALERIPYVLYQIAIVLFLGGEKLGHAGEAVYDQATLAAGDLLKAQGDRIARPVRFKEVAVPEASGNPYRTVTVGRLLEVGGLNAYANLKGLREAPVAAGNTLALQVEGFLEKQRAFHARLLSASESTGSQIRDQLSHEYHELEKDRARLFEQFLLDVMAAREKAFLDICERIQKHAELRNRVVDKIRKDFYISRRDHDLVLEAYLQQETLEGLLQIAQAPFYADRFLLKWSGVLAVLDGAPMSSVPTEAARWFPFVCSDLASSGHTERRSFAAVAKSLIHRGDDESSPLPLHEILPNSPPLYGNWRPRFTEYRAAVFNPELETFDRNDREALFVHIIANAADYFPRVRWDTLDRFFELIRDTPVEAVYQNWLANFSGRASSEVPGPLPASEHSEQVLTLLDSDVFNPAFRAYFRARLLHAGSDC